jgi:hypothetical protein
MSLLDKIEELKGASEIRKRKIAFVVASAFTLTIFLGWLMVYSTGSTTYTYSKNDENQEDVSPIGTLMSNFNEVKESISDMSDSILALPVDPESSQTEPVSE